jgi:hypothetical protein
MKNHAGDEIAYVYWALSLLCIALTMRALSPTCKHTIRIQLLQESDIIHELAKNRTIGLITSDL